MHKLQCSWQNYAWGKMGGDSEVAALVGAGKHSQEEVSEQKPYAELWMGVHPNGPSKLRESGKALSAHIEEAKAVAAHEQGTLQFLFKVLSVKSALSVQTHPTKEQAVVLHANDPRNYPDVNHKPEMAIALTEFQLLCGFRPAEQIHANISAYPELLSLISSGGYSLDGLLSKCNTERESSLRAIFTHVWNMPQDKLTPAIGTMIARLSAKDSKTDLDSLLIRLDREYPGGDVGVFAPLLLNYFTLSPGEATFLGPNRPHAYLFGDCIECMACSDNTIRAGLTPKFKDIITLCTNMDYTMSPPPLFPSTLASEGIRLYAPPVPEFAVQEIKSSAQEIVGVGSSSLLIVIRGSASLRLSPSESSSPIQKGDVIFLSSNIDRVSVEKASTDFLAFRAFTPIPK